MLNLMRSMHPSNLGKMALLFWGLVGALTWVPISAQADGFSAQLKSGLSSFSLSAGSSYSRSGGIGVELRPQASYTVDSILTSFAVFYQGRFGSEVGAFPFSRLGVGGYYYPMGISLGSREMENGIQMVQNRMAPFVTAQGAFTMITVTDRTVAQGAQSFNGQALTYLLGAGMEIPMGQRMALTLELLYEGTIAGGYSDSSGAQTSSGIRYFGFCSLLGLSFHP